MKWDYGDEGRAYPVKEGDVWRVGIHAFACSDLMTSTVFDLFLESMVSSIRQGPAIVYCDPPWGQALLNGFRTKAGLAKAEYRWEELYRRIATIGHARGLPVFIEGSKPSSRDGLKIPAAMGNPAVRSFDRAWEVTYYHKAANVSGLYYSGSRPLPLILGLNDPLSGKDDDDTPGIVMRGYGQTGVVIDPCAGRGQTSREAHHAGWGSLNNELNPFRVSAALVRLSKVIGRQPVKIGTEVPV